MVQYGEGKEGLEPKGVPAGVLVLFDLPAFFLADALDVRSLLGW